ncbi:MAG: hypothetical protein MHPSP_002061, partial [Paramarteilia canceri]
IRQMTGLGFKKGKSKSKTTSAQGENENKKTINFNIAFIGEGSCGKSCVTRRVIEMNEKRTNPEGHEFMDAQTLFEMNRPTVFDLVETTIYSEDLVIENTFSLI